MESHKIDLENKIQNCSNKEEIDPEKLLGYQLPIYSLNDFLDFENELKDNEEKIEKMVLTFIHV